MKEILQPPSDTHTHTHYYNIYKKLHIQMRKNPNNSRGLTWFPPYPLVQEESCRGEERACRRVSAFKKKKEFFCVCVFFYPSPQTICHLRKKKRFACNPDFSFFLILPEKKRVKFSLCVCNHLRVIFKWYESCFVGTGSKQGYFFLPFSLFSFFSWKKKLRGKQIFISSLFAPSTPLNNNTLP